MIDAKSLLASAENPTDKEEAFVEFLLASPSYQLAHKQRTVGLSKAEKKLLPPDFKKVLEVYDACGDIQGQGFDRWWQECGRDLLRFHQSRENLIAYPVDLNQPLSKLIKEFSQQIAELKEARKAKSSPIQILANKIKLGALHLKLELINEKGRLEHRAGKRIEHWRLAVQTGIKSKWKAELKPDSNKTVSNMEARTILGVLVSKHLKEALWIAENAARGVFPSMEPIDTGLEFDYYATYQLSGQLAKLNNKYRVSRKKTGERVRKTYYERKVKPAINRQKTIDALVEARLKLERLKQS